MQTASLTITLSSHATGTGRTLTASADFFTTNHINTYLKIDGKQVFITARTNATVVTATIIRRCW